jgi:hypothetical protein
MDIIGAMQAVREKCEAERIAREERLAALLNDVSKVFKAAQQTAKEVHNILKPIDWTTIRVCNLDTKLRVFYCGGKMPVFTSPEQCESWLAGKGTTEWSDPCVRIVLELHVLSDEGLEPQLVCDAPNIVLVSARSRYNTIVCKHDDYITSRGPNTDPKLVTLASKVPNSDTFREVQDAAAWVAQKLGPFFISPGDKREDPTVTRNLEL